MKKYIFVLCVFAFLSACSKPVQEEDITRDDGVKVEKPVTKPMACTKDARQCPDGRVVGRDPYNNCEFKPCEELKEKKEPMMCTADVKQCPDGSYVGRDSYNDCKFKECPPGADGRLEK